MRQTFVAAAALALASLPAPADAALPASRVRLSISSYIVYRDKELPPPIGTGVGENTLFVVECSALAIGDEHRQASRTDVWCQYTNGRGVSRTHHNFSVEEVPNPTTTDPDDHFEMSVVFGPFSQTQIHQHTVPPITACVWGSALFTDVTVVTAERVCQVVAE